jgi:hypothetical protein
MVSMSRVVAARDHFARATAEDGAYAQAHYRLAGASAALALIGPAREARGPLERALALDPGHTGTLGRLARIAALEGRHADLDALVTRVLAFSPDQDQALALRALRAWTRRCSTSRAPMNCAATPASCWPWLRPLADECRRLLSEASHHDAAWSLEVRGYLLALPFLAWPLDEIHAVRASIEA